MRDERVVPVLLHQPGGTKAAGLEAGGGGGEMGGESGGSSGEEAEEEEGSHGGPREGSQLPGATQSVAVTNFSYKPVEAVVTIIFRNARGCL